MSDFNLWNDPWIRVLRPDGERAELSIRDLLMQAHELRSLYDPSPLSVVGIHRLLTAILQSIYAPQSLDEIADLLEEGCFAQTRIDDFGAQYGLRFGLFDDQHPFMQTSDAPAQLGKEPSTVAYLLAEIPSGTNRIHFQHVTDDSHRLCPACCARAMMTIPAFAVSGGSGIKPSINGVPPIYLLPLADTLACSMILSLMAPDFQPNIASENHRTFTPWTTSQTVIPKIAETLEVGYIESLTFPARRIRLYATQEPAYCTHCGMKTSQYVKDVLYEMGLSRPKGAELWKDPFAAFRTTAKGELAGVRPVEGKALWREYSTLFLSEDTKQSNGQDLRPSVLLQMHALTTDGVLAREQLLRFRAIGIRTDGKAKIFEWFDEGLDVPAALLRAGAGRAVVQQALQRAEELGRSLSSIFAAAFRPHKDREWFKTLRERMIASYWTALAIPFRAMIQQSTEEADWDAIERNWAVQLLGTAGNVARNSLQQISGDANLLRRQVQAEQKINRELGKRRKEWIHD